MPRRLAQLLAAAKLAERDVGLARARAERDARNFATATQALQALVPAAGQMVDAYRTGVDEEAALGAQALLGENLTATGAATETPEQMATRLVRADKRLTGPKATGDVVQDFLADPGGFKRRAAEKAAVAAQGKLAAQVKGNRDAATKTTAQEAKVAADLAGKTAKAEAEAAKVEAARAAAEQKATGAKKDEIIQAAVESALATGEDPDEVSSRVRDFLAEQGILGVGSSEVRAAFEKARSAKTDADLKRELLRSQVAENQAQAAKAARPPSGPSETKAERERLALEKAKAELEALQARTEASKKKKEDGKPLSPDDLDELEGKRRAIRNLGDLRGLASGQDLGIFSAWQSQIPDWLSSLKSAERREFESANDRAVQNLAKALEGGRLTDADFQRYRSMLMKASDSKESYVRVLDSIAKEVEETQRRYEQALKESNYKVPSASGTPAASAALPGGDKQERFLARTLELKAQGVSPEEYLRTIKAEFPEHAQ